MFGWVVVVFLYSFSHNHDCASLVLLFFWSITNRNTDKMSDEEKLPIAIAGVAFISLPFIAGLIALYSAQGN